MFTAVLIAIMYTTMYTAMYMLTHAIVYELTTGHDMGIVVTTHMISLAIFGSAVLALAPRWQHGRGYIGICRMKLEVKLCNSDTPPPNIPLSV